MNYRMDIMGMINSWRVMRGAFVVAWSLLGFTEFWKGRNGVLYVVWLLEAVFEAAISGSNVSAFDVSTEPAIIALEGRLPSDTFGAYVTLGSQESAREDAFEWVPSRFPGRRSSWR